MLEKAQVVLSRNVKLDGTKISRTTTAANIEAKLTNFSNGLDVKDVISDLEASILSTALKMHTARVPKTSYETEYTVEDYQFDIYYFFGYFNNTRSYLIVLWEDYRDG